MNPGADSIYDRLVTYSESDFYPYHMPGHKRKADIDGLSDFFRIDITEIDGFDNLHNAEGIIYEAQKRAAALYGADESFFLVNGSTCGVLSAVLAVTDKSDKILAARNCHKSLYHAALLQELDLKYIYPARISEYDIHDAISVGDVESALEREPDCKAVVVTSPTYEGIISDIAAIAEAVHNRGKVLIVDEAHGAHLGLAENMPENAVRQGADLVIHSLHKTLPSMTQSALLHVSGNYVNRTKLRRYLNIFQSSSPSYILMAGMDACLSYVKENAARKFRKLQSCYQDFIKMTGVCRNIRIALADSVNGKGYSFKAWDISKLVISVKGSSISGQTLYDILRDEFHLQMEMAAATYVLAIMTIADDEAAWKRLADALILIDGRIIKDGAKGRMADAAAPEASMDIRPAAKMKLAQAVEASYENSKEVSLERAMGRVSADFVSLYPPGIPILAPGELIDGAVIEKIRHSQELGLNVQGMSDSGNIRVI